MSLARKLLAELDKVQISADAVIVDDWKPESKVVEKIESEGHTTSRT